MVYSDYHVHTSFSDDSENPMESAVRRAIELGLEEICFTEHVDYGVKTDRNCDCEAYFEELRRCQALFQGQIRIIPGMEFGMQGHTVGEFQRLYDKYPFEFIILSCHQVEDREFWTYEFQKGRTQEEYQRRYYEEILDVVRRYKDYHVLGHLDMINRYDPAGAYPFEKVRDIVTEILKVVIEDGKGIEINTSSFRYHLPDSTPSKEIIDLYFELGGKIVTVGSDAHTSEWIGYGITEAQKEIEKRQRKGEEEWGK